MSDREKFQLKLLETGVPGLDNVLGGGLPELSFNLIAGMPGSGKTTLAHQLAFAGSSDERSALYFTVLGEPPLKMLRYQQQMAFFDAAKVGGPIRFIDLSEEALEGDLGRVLDRIVASVAEASPSIVVVDSFRTVIRAGTAPQERLELQGFLQRLALQLASWEVTSFLVGEYCEAEIHDNPLFTIADGILWLTQHKDRSSMVRKLEVTKMRGLAGEPGLHTFRISSRGIEVFPRIAELDRQPRLAMGKRLSTGVPELDALLGGGIPLGDVTLVGGPSGTGKTVLGAHFLAEGAESRERGVLAIFEEHPQDYLERAKGMGHDLAGMLESGDLKIVNLRPLDLSADELLHQVRRMVYEIGATRLVIDSLNGLELALAPHFREDFRESIYRMVAALSSAGVTVLLTAEVTESFDQLTFSPHGVSFLAQNILFLRYVEIEGQLQNVIGVVKMRRSGHSRELHSYDITARGFRMGPSLRNFQGILTGVPAPRETARRSITPGLTERENALLDALLARREATSEALAQQMGLPRADVEAALDRLVQLNYAIEVAEEGASLYRPVVRALGR